MWYGGEAEEIVLWHKNCCSSGPSHCPEFGADAGARAAIVASWLGLGPGSPHIKQLEELSYLSSCGSEGKF